MKKEHQYQATITWTGNTGKGTAGYSAFERSHSISVVDKPEILGSSDPSFRGDPAKHNPEELLLASLSSCHMLWYLHLCATAKVVVTSYKDQAKGIMIEKEDGSGYFSEVRLHPVVTVAEDTMIEKAIEIHEKANAYCFIANSMNFKVTHHPQCCSEEDKKHQ